MKIRILLSLGLLASLAIGCEDLKFGDNFLENLIAMRSLLILCLPLKSMRTRL